MAYNQENVKLKRMYLKEELMFILHSITLLLQLVTQKVMQLAGLQQEH